jgi:hypothetical protein
MASDGGGEKKDCGAHRHAGPTATSSKTTIKTSEGLKIDDLDSLGTYDTQFSESGTETKLC